MTWQNINEQFTAKYDRHVVFCEDRYERAFIIALVSELFPHKTQAHIASAIDSCCAIVPSPRPRDWFFDCLQESLGEA